MPNEEWALFRYAALLEVLLEEMTEACKDMHGQLEEVHQNAMGVYDRHGNKTE